MLREALWSIIPALIEIHNILQNVMYVHTHSFANNFQGVMNTQVSAYIPG